MAPHSTLAFKSISSSSATSALSQARQLVMPTTQEMLQRSNKVYQFWDSNEKLLEDAWAEWQRTDNVATSLPKLDMSIINPRLRRAVEDAWKDPSKENHIKDLWIEVAPNVYSIHFFDMEKISMIREWFDTAAGSGIPTRPPYGIVLNRKGFMTDPRSVGYLAAPDFQTFYRDLCDIYVRPLGRLFFPEAILAGDDSATFSFSIQYQGEAGGDRSIRQHTDASTVTFNINLDSEKTWTGSSLIFYNRITDQRTNVEWQPGHAVMHLGSSMHAALPIETGTRSNFVIWTFGKNSERAYGSPMAGDDGCYPKEYQLTSEQRWTKPIEPPSTPWDRWSPF